MKMCSEVFQFEKELKWENPGPGIRRQIMGYDEQLMMVKVQFEKGAVGTMHEHHHSQATYVVSGKFELTIGEQKEILSAGDGDAGRFSVRQMWYEITTSVVFRLNRIRAIFVIY